MLKRYAEFAFSPFAFIIHTINNRFGFLNIIMAEGINYTFGFSNMPGKITFIGVDCGMLVVLYTFRITIFASSAA